MRRPASLMLDTTGAGQRIVNSECDIAAKLLWNECDNCVMNVNLLWDDCGTSEKCTLDD